MATSPPPNDEKARLQAHLRQQDLDSNNNNNNSSSMSQVNSAGPPSGSSAAPPPPPAGYFDPKQQTQQRHDGGSERGPTPPPYSGPSRGSPAETRQETTKLGQSLARGPVRYTGLPPLDYRLYAPDGFELLPDAAGIRTVAAHLSSHAAALAQLVRTQATVPPKPTIVISGNRGRKVDFAVRCNLMGLLVPEDRRARLDYLRCIGEGEPGLRGGTKADTIPHVGDGGLDGWIALFLRDQSHTKAFVLERQVANLDINWLEGQIRTLVATTGYKGVVTVKFPVLHARVVVQSPDRVNKFFTSVSTLFTGKSTYEVVKAVWPFATHKSGEPGRRCVVQSEEAWWREWCDPIKYAVATKRTGWVTNEDKLEAIMEGKGRGITAVDWGSEYDMET